MAASTVTSCMGTGGVSAFAATRGEISTLESPPASSTDGSEDFLRPNQNSFLALSNDPGTIPAAPHDISSDDFDNVSVRLTKNENVFVTGIYSLWVKRGEVSLLGASLSASSTLHHVFVPVVHSIPSITAVSDLAEVVMSTNNSRARYLGEVSHHFPFVWDPSPIPALPSFHVLGYHSTSARDVVGQIRLLATEQWLPHIRQILRRESATTPRILVSGAKGTGKSTLCRVLVNTILTKTANGTPVATKAFPDGVLFLDIDPGQPELAAPGIIYLAHVRAPLLGTPLTNFIVPGMTENVMLKMHYIGAYTPRESPSHYQRCVSDLLSLHRSYEHLPLIINTCGWNTGYGKTIFRSAVQGLVLTDILHVGETLNEFLHELLQPDVGGEQKVVTQIPPQPNKTPIKSAKDFREMQLQSYVHAVGFFNGRILWDQFPVTTWRNMLPEASDITDEVFAVIVLGQDIAPEHIADALDGSLAAIVVIKHDSRLHGLSNEVEQARYDADGGIHVAHTINGQLPYLVYRDHTENPLDPETTECIGLGLVTCGHSRTKRLRIKSPISAAHMTEEIGKGYRIALVLAQQQGLWSTLESILAREDRAQRSQTRNEGSFAVRERGYGETQSGKRIHAEAMREWEDTLDEIAQGSMTPYC